MFDWFWRLLYSLSQILYELIDGVMSIANKLCGIEKVQMGGKDVDFLTHLMANDKISYGFVAAVLCATLLVAVFSVFAMIKAVKGEGVTPAQVVIKVCKTLFTFFLVPICMVVVMFSMNKIMMVMYKATSGGEDSIGDFLFKSFCPDGMITDGMRAGTYESTTAVEDFLSQRGRDLSDYRFFFSWLCCVPILFALAKSMLLFVDRTISIVILYIVSPFSIATNVVDDGAHFKLWRDQILVKFITGYGTILGINVYILIVSIISASDVVFFEKPFLNFLFKVAFILGGAFSLERLMALIGNLVSAGAGSNEMRDAAIAAGSMAGAARFVGKAGLAPFKAGRWVANKVNDARQHGVGSTIGNTLGFKTNRDFGALTKIQRAQNDQRDEKRAGMNRSGGEGGAGPANVLQTLLAGKGDAQNDGNRQQNEPKQKPSGAGNLSNIIAGGGLGASEKK